MTAPVLSPGWRPAAERMLSIPAPQRIRGMGPTPTNQLTLRPKTSADNIDYGLCPEQWLENTGDFVSHVWAKVLTGDGSKSDLVVSWATIISGVPVLFLGGGHPGTVEIVQVNIITQQGRLWAAPVYVPITDALDATPARPVPIFPDGTPVPPNAIRLPDGSILTDNNGQPFIIA